MASIQHRCWAADLSLRKPRRALERLVFVVQQDPPRIAVEIFILARSQAPEEGGKAKRAETQRAGDQDHHDIHGEAFSVNCKRKALSVTISDDDDIASAAIRGVRKPNAAAGAAMRL